VFYLTFSLENSGSTVSNILEVTSCITCLATHPTNEHLITAGLYNGTAQVLMINILKRTLHPHTQSPSFKRLTWRIVHSE